MDRISVQSVQGTHGENVKVIITVENPQELNAFAMKLSYSPDLLQLQKISSTSSTESWFALEGIMANEGSLTIGGFNTDGISSGESVALVEVTFTVREGARSHAEFHLTNLVDDFAGAQIRKGSLSMREMPTMYSLSQNCPNPFNPETEIEYSLPEAARVTLTVDNTLGQAVNALVSAEHDAGYHTVIWNGENAASGIYFCRIMANEFTATKRMVLLR